MAIWAGQAPPYELPGQTHFYISSDRVFFAFYFCRFFSARCNSTLFVCPKCGENALCSEVLTKMVFACLFLELFSLYSEGIVLEKGLDSGIEILDILFLTRNLDYAIFGSQLIVINGYGTNQGESTGL